MKIRNLLPIGALLMLLPAISFANSFEKETAMDTVAAEQVDVAAMDAEMNLDADINLDESAADSWYYGGWYRRYYGYGGYYPYYRYYGYYGWPYRSYYRWWW